MTARRDGDTFSRVLRPWFPALLLLALVCAGSCTVGQSVVIKSDGSGTASLRVAISRLLRDYLLSLAEVSGQADQVKQGRVFDLQEIRKGFAGRQGITIQRLESPSPDTLEMDLGFRSLEDLFVSDPGLAGAGAFTLTQSGGTRTLTMHLDKRTFGHLSALFPVLADPTIAGLGPQPNDTVTEDEYLSMIEFALGAGGPELVKKSFITVTIRPEGQVVSQTGGSLSNGAVSYRIPLLSLLVLSKPLDYSISFR